MTRANRPRKLRKDYHPCGCCYIWEPVRARARQADKHEVLTQLTEVPDEERVFADFRELPDDAWEQCSCSLHDCPENPRNYKGADWNEVG